MDAASAWRPSAVRSRARTSRARPAARSSSDAKSRRSRPGTSTGGPPAIRRSNSSSAASPPSASPASERSRATSHHVCVRPTAPSAKEACASRQSASASAGRMRRDERAFAAAARRALPSGVPSRARPSAAIAADHSATAFGSLDFGPRDRRLSRRASGSAGSASSSPPPARAARIGRIPAVAASVTARIAARGIGRNRRITTAGSGPPRPRRRRAPRFDLRSGRRGRRRRDCRGSRG